MKTRNILIAALIMAILTTVLFRTYLKNLDNKYNSNQKRISIVVAKQSIKKNQMVTKDMLEIKEFSADSVHPEAVKKIEDIAGNYALTEIKVGEIIFASRFTNQFKESEELTRKIQDGYRAVAIEVNYVESVATMIEPENYVDVIFSEKVKDGGNNQIVKTETLLSKVRVLAVGKRIVEKQVAQATSEDSKASGTTQTQVEYNSATLELKPEDIIKIVNADERGNIKFVLNSKIAP